MKFFFEWSGSEGACRATALRKKNQMIGQPPLYAFFENIFGAL